MRTGYLVLLVALTALIFLPFSMTTVEARNNVESEILERISTFSKAVPALLNYQGFLATADSGAVSETLGMTFRLFDSEAKGVELWSETHSTVEVSNGQFQVLLGSVTPFSAGLFAGPTLWLQTEVASEVLSPRKAIVSVAYSQMADEADHAATADYATEAGHASRADTAAYSPGTNPWSVSGDDVYRLTGNVGIGTASPTAELEVIGTVDADGLTINGTPVGTSTDSYWNLNQSDIAFPSGNVGVGTSSPTAKLQVVSGKSHDVQICTDNYALYAQHSGGNISHLCSAEMGVYGYNASTENYGVLGGEGGRNCGVYGIAFSSEGYGAYGGHNSSGNWGALGDNQYGVYGSHPASSNYGYLASEDYGAYGHSTASGNYGVLGSLYGGVEGHSNSLNQAVLGHNHTSGNLGRLGTLGSGASGENSAGTLGQLGTEDQGVYGLHGSTGNYGYVGCATSGVEGWTDSPNQGVLGINNNSGNIGRLGTLNSGVTGSNANSTLGRLASDDHGAYGMHGSSGNFGHLGSSDQGAYGEHSNGTYGLLGGSLVGAYGHNTNGNFASLGENNHAVYAYHNSGNFGYFGNSDYGAYGRNSAGHYGYLGGGVGAYGRKGNGNWGNLGDSNNGAYGQNNNDNKGGLGNTDYGAWGLNNNNHLGVLGAGDKGVYGVHNNENEGTLGDISCGVQGINANGNNGCLGRNDVGVYGENFTSGNSGYIGSDNQGVYGAHSNGNNGYLGGSQAAVKGNQSSGYAGYFVGDAYVTNHLSKGTGSFKIDHPLDPENMYLYHSFVESPDMMNVYNGNAVLGTDGQAWVELPDWFEALNKDFRYQLTCIGGFAPVYIEQEISGNRFKIAGGTAGTKVSWQVTGIRQDPLANARRVPVEEEKPPEERGYYMHPDAYGLPDERNVEWIRDPEMMRRSRERAERQGAKHDIRTRPERHVLNLDHLAPLDSEVKQVVDLRRHKLDEQIHQQLRERSSDDLEPRSRRQRQGPESRVKKGE